MDPVGIVIGVISAPDGWYTIHARTCACTCASGSWFVGPSRNRLKAQATIHHPSLLYVLQQCSAREATRGFEVLQMTLYYLTYRLTWKAFVLTCNSSPLSDGCEPGKYGGEHVLMGTP